MNDTENPNRELKGKAMRKFAIIGGGQAGLHIGFALLKAGHAVTLYSDRTPAEILGSRIPSTAFLFNGTLEMERELGLNFWEDLVPYGEGMHVDFRDPTGAIGLTVQGRLEGRKGQALDQRTKFSRWLEEFPKRGGKLVIKAVSVEELDQISAENDLTIVTAGKGNINALFERDDQRSVHTKPPRHLAALLLTGPKLMGDRPWSRVPFRPLRFNFVAGAGEFFSLPFYTHTVGECRSVLFEAIPGGPIDRFQNAQSGEELLEIAKGVIREFSPDDAHHFEDVQLTDPNAWLKGAFTPTIRKPVGRLPSGRFVMGVGDTVVLNDPITGQGSNNAARMSKFVIEKILAMGEGSFTPGWVNDVVDTFWNESGQYTSAFTNALLNPPPPSVMEVLVAASQTPAIADKFMQNFDKPSDYWPWLVDLDLARKFIVDNGGHLAA